MTAQRADRWLLGGAAASALAAALHLGCVMFGATWYRFLGAGEHMARLAEAGSIRPTLITLVIAMVLLLWSGYALSGAGATRRWPLLRSALIVITAIYLLRGLAGLLLAVTDEAALGRSATFWAWSSSICLAIGVTHLVGLRSRWPQLAIR